MPTDNGPKRDVSPEKYSTPKKDKGESHNNAMNAPNNPTKNHPPMSFNVNDDYTAGDNSCGGDE